jgi:hypothetical protein
VRFRAVGFARAFTHALRIGVDLAFGRTVEAARVYLALGHAALDIAVGSAGCFSGCVAHTLTLGVQLAGAGQLHLRRIAVGLTATFDLHLAHRAGFDVDVAAAIEAGVSRAGPGAERQTQSSCRKTQG